jgi:hypothetical protein
VPITESSHVVTCSVGEYPLVHTTWNEGQCTGIQYNDYCTEPFFLAILPSGWQALCKQLLVHFLQNHQEFLDKDGTCKDHEECTYFETVALLLPCGDWDNLLKVRTWMTPPDSLFVQQLRSALRDYIKKWKAIIRGWETEKGGQKYPINFLNKYDEMQRLIDWLRFTPSKKVPKYGLISWIHIESIETRCLGITYATICDHPTFASLSDPGWKQLAFFVIKSITLTQEKCFDSNNCLTGNYEYVCNKVNHNLPSCVPERTCEHMGMKALCAKKMQVFAFITLVRWKKLSVQLVKMIMGYICESDFHYLYQIKCHCCKQTKK